MQHNAIPRNCPSLIYARSSVDASQLINFKMSSFFFLQVFDDTEVGERPLLSYLTKYKPNQIITLLETQAEWVQDLGEVSSDQCLWIYALLGLVEKPLHADDVSTIRSLARVAKTTRAALTGTGQSVTHLNLLICIVANYFEQKDLSD